MAGETDSPSFGNFGIEDTMEMGMGNRQLINDLISPETSTANLDDVKPIIKEVTEEKPKEVKPLKTTTDEVVKEEQNVLKDFLEDTKAEEVDGDDEKAPVKTEGDEEEVSEEGTQFTALAKELLKLGVFTTDEDEQESAIATGEEFLDRFNAEKKKGATEMVNNFIAQFGQDYQDAFDAIYVKGVNPKDYFGAYNTIVDFANLDMTVEENQVAVIKRALNDQGFEPEDITTEVDRLKNYGDLESVAAKHHKVLVKKEAVKLQQMEQKAEHEMQQKTALRNQYIQNVQTTLQEKLKNKEFDGIPLNPKLATELQDFLLVDKYKTASGETLTDFDRFVLELKRPENHAMKVKVALLLKILEKDPTLSTIQKTGVSKKTDQLFGEVVRQVQKKPVQTNTQNSWFK
jgi:hypothetical protein